MMDDYLHGFIVGISLIVAVGAQNVFVMRQGIMRQNLFAVCAICAVSDAFLISLSVMGVGVLIASMPILGAVMRYGGAAFCVFYGALRLHAAWKGGQAMAVGSGERQPLRQAVIVCLSFTFLNPNVWIDTMILIGGISHSYGGDPARFGVGAVIASFVFFFSLGYGARLLSPFFAKPAAWRILDCLTAMMMLGIAAKLVL